VLLICCRQDQSPAALLGTWNAEHVALADGRFFCGGEPTPPRKQKVRWWRQFSEGNIVSLSTCSDEAIYCFLIYIYFSLLLVRESGRSCWSSHHRNPAEISTQQSSVFRVMTAVSTMPGASSGRWFLRLPLHRVVACCFGHRVDALFLPIQPLNF
jgi:hypothetical protein